MFFFGTCVVNVALPGVEKSKVRDSPEDYVQLMKNAGMETRGVVTGQLMRGTLTAARGSVLSGSAIVAIQCRLLVSSSWRYRADLFTFTCGSQMTKPSGTVILKKAEVEITSLLNRRGLGLPWRK